MSDEKNEHTIEGRIESFYGELQAEKYTALDIFKQIIKADLEAENVRFLLGIEERNCDKDSFKILEGSWEKYPVNGTFDPKESFRKVIGYESDEEPGFEYCRCIGMHQKECKKIYCYIALYYDKSVDNTYVSFVCQTYSTWISYFISEILKMARDQRIGYSRRIKKDKKNLFQNINRAFYEHMAAVYNIDLDIITGISGSYYESESCCSQIVFQLSDSCDDMREGITFGEYIEFSTGNIRKLRKLLQMGNAEQYLLACAEIKDGIFKWKIKGLYGDKIGKETITFRLTQHMVWTMDIEGRTCICHKCGKYVIENSKMEILKIEKRVKEVFNLENADGLKEIFREAINQRHGTIIVVLEEKNMISDKGTVIMGEITRLITESTGFAII